jgi:cadherin 15 (M-cadherin)
VGGAIGRIKADDPDIGRNAEMDYSIVGGHDMFNIITDQTTQEGVLVVRKVSTSSTFRKKKHHERNCVM